MAVAVKSPASGLLRENADQCDVLVHGAGAIGLYLGGRLAASGLRVHFVARSRIAGAIRADGLRVRDLAGQAWPIDSTRISVSETVAEAPTPALVLLTVKGTATASAAAELAVLPATTPVISFQNGVANRQRLAQAAPQCVAIAGMVPFNVVQSEPGCVRQTTSGELACADTPVTRQWAARFAAAGLPLQLHADMAAVQWGKLLLNLNNPLNALAGIPLREQLRQRDYRCLLAALQDEALAALRAAGITPARVTPLPSAWLPKLLRLPNWLFERLARRMLTIAADARSSMYDDRIAGRPTEIDDLCGAVIALGQQHGVTTPVNARLRELILTTPGGVYFDAANLRGRLGA